MATKGAKRAMPAKKVPAKVAKKAAAAGAKAVTSSSDDPFGGKKGRQPQKSKRQRASGGY
jgi:dTDP-4-dehydrorhamnose reductase